MAQISYHSLDENTYRTELVSFLKPLENRPLSLIADPTNTTARGLKPEYDGGTNLAIGYGFDLFVKSFTEIVTDFSQVGVTFADPVAVETAINQAKQQAQQIIAQHGKNTPTTITMMDQLGLQLGTLVMLPNVITAENLLKLELERQEMPLDDLLAARGIPRDPVTGLTIPFSKEREALASLFYNNPILIGTALTGALQRGNRGEVWFEIRYKSNADAQHTSRRINESNLFGLYNSPELGVQEAEAKDVLRMYTTHRTDIQDYEARFATRFPSGGTTSIQFQIIAARSPLIQLYAQGRTIDGEVLVGIDNVFAPEHLSGTAQGDLIFGEFGLDRLRGNEGSDVLYGGLGDDELTGGLGDDYLDGGQGADTYVFLTGDGADTIRDADGLGTIRYDGTVLVGGIRDPGHPAGTFLSSDPARTYTYFYPVAGGDLVITRTGEPGDSLTLRNFQSGQLGIRLLDFGASPSGTPATIDYNNGQPTVRYDGDETDNTPTFTAAANHEAFGFGGNDILDFESGSALFNHQLFGGIGHDDLRGGAGDDRIFGEAGRDLIVGGPGGDDVLDGGDEIDLLKGGDGRDALYGGAGNDGLDGGSGDDVLLGGGGDDVISGESIGQGATTTGNDYLDGGAGADWLMGLMGDDVLVGGSENDRLYGDQAPAEAPNLVLTYPGIVTFAPGVAFTSATGGADYLEGGAGEDYLQGDAGDDVLLGGADNDTLYGDDHTVGVLQEGQDWLDGGAGNDTLYGGGGADTLLGGPDDDTLFGDFTNDPVGANDWLDGGAGRDTLVGARGDDILYGGTEDDLLFGNEGQDVLDGGSGEDELQGGPGADLLRGGPDNDRLFGQEGADQLFGDAGNDVLVGDLEDDVLEGGAGDDTLVGEAGADTYVFNLGDGTDTIDDTAGEANRVVFGTGISADGLALGQGSLRIIVAATGDELHILNFDPNDPFAVNPISSFEFQDGTVLTSSQLVAQGFDLVGTPGNDFLSGGAVYPRVFGLGGDDTLTGGTGDNLLDGGAGNDQLFGREGLDTLEGREGADQLFGEDGDDVLQGGADNDYLSGGQGSDVLHGGAGDDQLFGDGGGNETLFGGDGTDTLYGAEGDDLLDGGAGNDFLYGSSGSDTYLFGLGSGQDTLQESDFAGTDLDTVELGEGIAPGDVTLQADQSDNLLGENGEKVSGTFFLIWAGATSRTGAPD